jgi:4-aminobutyrate aminotransferase-like enzyme
VNSDVHAMQETAENVVFIDYLKSKGSYAKDVDGHVFLDMSSTEFMPLGHNHPEMLKVNKSP